MAHVTSPAGTILRVSVRPGWYQRTMIPFNSPEMLERMHQMGALAFRQFDSLYEVTVSAQRGGKSRVMVLERGPVEVRRR